MSFHGSGFSANYLEVGGKVCRLCHLYDLRSPFCLLPSALNAVDEIEVLCTPQDTALMYAVANAIASIPGLVLPAVGLYLMRKTNSYLPLFAGCGAITMLAGVYFNAVASVQPARELLALSDKAAGKRSA